MLAESAVTSHRDKGRTSLYEPIYTKIKFWIEYEKNRPKTDYDKNKLEYDNFRSQNDLDCILRNGNLNADTIFSLWLPLRLSLVRVSGYRKIKRITGFKTDKENIDFLKALISDNNLENLLPQDNRTTILLSELFSLGQEIENTMILPNRSLQERGRAPFYDYLPYFLFECFEKGYFHRVFGSNENFKNWIIQENLECFFNGAICRENIIDLAGTGNIKYGIPDEINYLLSNYIRILKIRKLKFDKIN